MEADMAEQAYTVCGGRMYLVPVILYMVEYPSDSDDRQGGKSGDRYGCRESPERDERITLDQETVTTIMQEYLDYTEDSATSSDDPELEYLSEEMYRTWYLPNRDLIDQICGIYIQDGQGNMSVRQLFEENLGKDFYEARKDRVQETLSTCKQR